MKERSLPPHHIINSYLTRTICVQAGELRQTGGGGEQRRGRRRDLCSQLTKSLKKKKKSRQTSGLKSETTEGTWLSEHSLPLSLHFFQTGFAPLEAVPTQTLLLPQWMVSNMFCPCLYLKLYSLFGCCTRNKHRGFLTFERKYSFEEGGCGNIMMPLKQHQVSRSKKMADKS